MLPALTEDRRVARAANSIAAGAGLLMVLQAETAWATDGPSLESQGGRPRKPHTRWIGPSLDHWVPEFVVPHYRPPKAPPADYTHLARPDTFRVPVYSNVEPPRSVIARTRRGEVLPARKVDTTRSCTDNGAPGTWWEVPDGFICSASGYTITTQLEPEAPRQHRPALNLPLPFRYARVTTKGAARFSRRPTSEELEYVARWSDDAPVPGSVIERMWDDFFVALDKREKVGDTVVYRNIYGEYIRGEDLKLLDPPPMHGERLGQGLDLPMAFVFGEEPAPLYCETARGLEVCGEAEKHARFAPSAFVARRGRNYVRGPDRALVPAERLRVARRIARPPGVLPETKWVHIDLSQQTLVAYEGDTPVFVTLVSSGKPTHATPSGLYQVQRKFLTKIMRGNDPKEGIYHVEEVPWTTYYHGAYAIHGAYWHNTFGSVRSHGCTNVAPADARWLYFWGDPKRKPHFHALVREQATHFYFTED